MPSSSILLVCIECRQKIRIPAEKFGQQGVCPRCKTPFPAVQIAEHGSSRLALFAPPSWLRLSTRTALAACWGYVALLLLIAAAMHLLGEYTALHTLVIFGPRWVWALPLPVLVAVGFVVTRHSFLPCAIGCAVWLLAVSGFVLTWPTQEGRPGESLRIVTCNMQGGGIDYLVFNRYLLETNADVVLLQEWTDGHRKAAFAPSDWQLAESGGLWIASRGKAEALPGLPKGKLKISAGAGAYKVATRTGEIRLVNVHLPTAREGISAVLYRRLSGLAALNANAQARDEVSQLVREFGVTDAADVIVAGDFNMPVESSIYQRQWGDLQNAFSQAGFGWGSTKYTSWYSLRIDHLLYGRSWKCTHCSVGPDIGSDHRPVLAVLEASQGT